MLCFGDVPLFHTFQQSRHSLNSPRGQSVKHSIGWRLIFYPDGRILYFAKRLVSGTVQTQTHDPFPGSGCCCSCNINKSQSKSKYTKYVTVLKPMSQFKVGNFTFELSAQTMYSQALNIVCTSSSNKIFDYYLILSVKQLRKSAKV